MLATLGREGRFVRGVLEAPDRSGTPALTWHWAMAERPGELKSP